jgi:hypothetical protein
VPTIPALDTDEHIIDPFEIDPKLVEGLKAKLFQETEEMLHAEKRSGGASGSRRSSKASLASRKSRKTRQMSASSRQSSVTGPAPAATTPSGRKPKHTEGLFAELGPGQGTVEEDEMDEGAKETVEQSVQESNMGGMQNIQAQYEQDIRIAEMQAEMVEFDNKIFVLVCEKDELETRLKFAEISAILLYEEFQVVNQDQELEANLKAEVVRQEANLDRLNVKLLDVEKHLVVKQKNVDSLKEQKKNIYETVERELSDNKHSDFLWELYNKKPTSQHQQEVLSPSCPSLSSFLRRRTRCSRCRCPGRGPACPNARQATARRRTLGTGRPTSTSRPTSWSPTSGTSATTLRRC